MATWAKLGGAVDTNTGSKVAAVTTALLGDLLVVYCAHSGNTTVVSPTDDNADGLGTGTAYTQVGATRTWAAAANTATLWVRNALLGSAASFNVTHAPGVSTGGGVDVEGLTGMFKAGAASIARTGGKDQTASSGTVTPTGIWTAGAPNGTNPVYGALSNNSNNAAVTQPASFDARPTNAGYATPTTGFAVYTDETGNTDAPVTWGSTSPSQFVTLIAEFDASGGADFLDPWGMNGIYGA